MIFCEKNQNKAGRQRAEKKKIEKNLQCSAVISKCREIDGKKQKICAAIVELRRKKMQKQSIAMTLTEKLNNIF